MRAQIFNFQNAGMDAVFAPVAFIDDTTTPNTMVGVAVVNFPSVLIASLTPANIRNNAAILTNLGLFAVANGIASPTSYFFVNDPIISTAGISGQYSDLIGLPTAPQSYQAILSQSGTSAPTSGITPLNTYSGAPTFTIARVSAGVYTITASAAVFSLTKTSCLVGSLSNLNASIKAFPTSTTVITITTAVQSVAILGLLGLTTTPTDALLTNTQITINTYP